MGKQMALFFGFFLFALGLCCSAIRPGTVERSYQELPSHEIVIRVYEFGNPINKIMQLFSSNGLLITSIQQFQLSDDKQEIKIAIRNGNTRKLNELEVELRNVMNVRSVLIRRI